MDLSIELSHSVGGDENSLLLFLPRVNLDTKPTYHQKHHRRRLSINGGDLKQALVSTRQFIGTLTNIDCIITEGAA